MTSVFMRGGESDYVQVLVDGIQVNDPGGAFDWAHLRTEDIDRIEIVSGPGQRALRVGRGTGVVQLFTRSGGAHARRGRRRRRCGPQDRQRRRRLVPDGQRGCILTGSTNAIPLRDASGSATASPRRGTRRTGSTIPTATTAARRSPAAPRHGSPR
jgi:hypothetical protein